MHKLVLLLEKVESVGHHSGPYLDGHPGHLEKYRPDLLECWYYMSGCLPRISWGSVFESLSPFIILGVYYNMPLWIRQLVSSELDAS